jgi:hypothetical protein
VDTILEFSNNQQTKYYALQILESVIKTRWKILPRNQCEGIKKYIVGLIIKTSSDPNMLEKEKTYLNKLNMILVQVSFHKLGSMSEGMGEHDRFISSIFFKAGANPTSVSYNASAVKICNATISLVRFEKNSTMEKSASTVVNSEVVGLAPGHKD